MNTLLLSFQFLLFGLLGAHAPQASGTAAGFDGLWDTSFGRMRLNVAGSQVLGTYASIPGSRIEGEVRGDVLEFRYREPNGSGEGRFELSEDGKALAGRWRADGVEQWSPWPSERIEPRPGVRWLVVLEARWEAGLHEPEVTFGEMLRSYLKLDARLEVRERRFHDEADFRRFAEEVAFLAEPAYVLVSTHASPAGLSVGGRTIEPEVLAESLAHAGNVELLHLAGCDLLRGDAAERIRTGIPEAQRFPISGYTTTVDWAASALSDLTYLTFVALRGMSPEKALEQTYLAAPYTGDARVVGSALRPLGLTLLTAEGQRAALRTGGARTLRNGPNQMFGAATTWLDDVDGDGWHDIAVPGPKLAFGEGSERGEGLVLIVSGRDGAVLHDIRAQPGEIALGGGLATIGDLDGDGVGELVVHGKREGSDFGFLRCLSPATSAVHWERPSLPEQWPSPGLRTLVDFDGDGVLELAAWGGDPGSDGPPYIRERLEVVSGKTGWVMARRTFSDPGWNVVVDVRVVEDVDRDGLADLALMTRQGAMATRGGVRLELASSATLEQIEEFEFDVPLSPGFETADLNGDGRPELLVKERTAYKGDGSGGSVPSSFTILVLDMATRSLRDWIVVRNPSKTAGEFRWRGVLHGVPKPQLLVSAADPFAGQLSAVDLGSGETTWTLPGARHVGNLLQFDTDPEQGRTWALIGGANPFGGGAHRVRCIDPVTGEERFRLDPVRLLEAIGL